ncbi:MAG: S-methyl-5-thioribose kinase [Pseudomonadota bacterium]|nr:S-methyl-5-thioribose kinase [Pseudomonadota bacterium]
MTPEVSPAYRPLDPAGVVALISDLDSIRARLGGTPESWQVREVGDGNLNLVFIVEGPAGAVCVKQALPYVRVAGPSWPMSLQRAFFENAYFRSVGPHVAGLIPEIYHYDAELYCIIMQRLSPHIILRQGLMGSRRYANVGRDIGEYVARACFFTSDLARPFECKLKEVALFSANHELIRISVDLIFVDPYRESARNRHTTPQLDGLVAQIRRDGRLKAAASRFGQKFLVEAQALLHGDLHSGSVMVTDDDTRVIDPEFAFFGPIGFDLGAFFGNLLLSWFCQSGHATASDDRCAAQAHIVDQARNFWQTFSARFTALWVEHGAGDAYPPALFARSEDATALADARRVFMEGLFADMLGFAACKMIRRIVGFAHVADFETIREPVLRSRCEAAALRMARQLLTYPRDFAGLDAVFAALPRSGRD